MKGKRGPGKAGVPGKAQRAIQSHAHLTGGEKKIEKIMDGHFLDCPIIQRRCSAKAL